MAIECPLDEVVLLDVITSHPGTGAVTDADSTPTFAVYEETTDTDIGVGGNLTKRTSLTGNYRGQFTASAANGFELGKFYSVIASATVNAIAGKVVVRTFRIVAAELVAGYLLTDTGKWLGGTIPAVNVTGIPKVDQSHLLGTAFLTPAVAGTPDVNAKQLGGVVPGSATVGTVTTVGTLTTYTGNTPQTGDNYARIGAAGAGLTAVGLSTAGILAIWHQLTSAIVTASTIGKLLVDNVNATISSRSSHTAADVWASTTRTLSSFGTLVADVATAVWGATTRTLSAFGFTVTATADPNVATILAAMGALTAGERNAIADAIFARSLGTEGYAADGAVPTFGQFCFMMLSGNFEFSISGTTITGKKLDGSTPAMIWTLDSATAPTSRTRAT